MGNINLWVFYYYMPAAVEKSIIIYQCFHDVKVDYQINQKVLRN